VYPGMRQFTRRGNKRARSVTQLGSAEAGEVFQGPFADNRQNPPGRPPSSMTLARPSATRTEIPAVRVVSSSTTRGWR
jgi:hypothetical protein